MRRLDLVPTQNLDAYSAYLLGRHRLTDRTVTGLVDAVAQFARAIEIDPNYAAAYSGLVDACYLYREYTGRRSHERCPRNNEELEVLARKAVTLDVGLGEAWVSLGQILRDRGAPREEAQAAFERGLALNPSHTLGYHWHSKFLAENGQRSLSREVARDGLKVDPLSVPLLYQLSTWADVDGEFEVALRYAQRIIEIVPDSPRGFERLAEIHAGVDGRFDLALRDQLHAARLDPGQHEYFWGAGLGYLALQDYDSALRCFEAGAELSGPPAAVARPLGSNWVRVAVGVCNAGADGA